MKENGDNSIVVDVEIDGLDSVVTVDAPESIRGKLKYSCDVRAGKKVFFKLIIDGDEVKENGDQNLGEDDDYDSSFSKARGFNKKSESGEHDSGKKDECGDIPSSDCQGFDEECETSCPENLTAGQDDVRKAPRDETKASESRNSGPTEERNAAPCNADDENRSAKTEEKDGQGNFHPGENPKEYAEDEYVKRETSAEDAEESVRDECRTPDCDDGTFKYEESRDDPFSRSDHWDYDNDQFDWSCSFYDEQNAVFLSDLDFHYCNDHHDSADSVEMEEGGGVENSGEDDGTSSEAKSTMKDECGNDASDCKDLKGSYGNLDEECGRTCHGRSRSGLADMNIARSSWSLGKGDNAKEDDDFFKETFVEDHKSAPDFKHEQRHDDKKDNQSRATDEDDCHVVQDDMVSERERMKETDGYKRAVEAEWAARQQEIQNQAEEAQTLRKRRKLEMSEAEKKVQEAERQLKRKKAEELRAMNLQKRQKERVQEIKEAGRKDEADSNAKERYRGAVRQYVSRLESRCKDLPSLLHALGFGVASGSKPSPVEVRKAYKRAMLKYHPDHMLKAGIPQQVEAEEMFKLIRKMNEKYFTHVKG